MTHADARRPAGRVLFVTHNVPRFEGDAAGSFVLRLAVALIAAGWHVDVLAPAAPGLTGTDTIEGVHIERVVYAPEPRMTLAYTGTMAESVKKGIGGKLALLGLLYQMRKRIRARIREAVRNGTPYDVVHAHWWFPSGLAAWSAGVGASLPVPMVITMHGSDVRLAQGTTVSHGLMRRVLNRARVRTAVSKWLASAAQSIAPNTAVEIGPMPVNTAVFVPPLAGSVRDGILFVGRLNAQKGVADLLSAFQRMNSTRALLTIVGDGPDESALRSHATALGVAQRVQWLGALPQPDVVELYKQAKVVAMPSREEGLGLVAVEAQLSETPVVAYASGGLFDVVLPDQGGTLVAAGDIGAFATALDSFSAPTDVSRARVREFGMLARQAMLHQFSSNVVARRYIAWYKQAQAAQ